MMRTALLVLSVAGAACTVGQIPDVPADARMPAAGCVERITPPATAHKHTLGGGTNAGVNCMLVGACHLPGSGAGAGPAFQFAGTIYKSDGVTPNPGVNLRIKPVAGGTPLVMVSDDAGNFSETTVATLPATTDATACPTLTPMISQLQAVATGGACNSCHARTGGTTTPITLAD